MYRDVLEADIEDVKVYFFHNHYCCVQDVIADSKTTGERNESNKLIADSKTGEKDDSNKLELAMRCVFPSNDKRLKKNDRNGGIWQSGISKSLRSRLLLKVIFR